MPDYLVPVADAFWACNSMRSIGMGAGPLPIDRVFWYLEQFIEPHSPDELDRWLRLIRQMDGAYLKATAPKKSTET